MCSLELIKLKLVMYLPFLSSAWWKTGQLLCKHLVSSAIWFFVGFWPLVGLL